MELFEQAIRLLEARKFKAAKDLLQEVLMEDPKQVDALYNLGMCFTELGEPEKAIKTLDQCIKEQPNYSNAYVAKGYALARMNDLTQAKEYLFRV